MQIDPQFILSTWNFIKLYKDIKASKAHFALTIWIVIDKLITQPNVFIYCIYDSLTAVNSL